MSFLLRSNAFLNTVSMIINQRSKMIFWQQSLNLFFRQKNLIFDDFFRKMIIWKKVNTFDVFAKFINFFDFLTMVLFDSHSYFNFSNLYLKWTNLQFDKDFNFSQTIIYNINELINNIFVYSKKRKKTRKKNR